VQSRVQLIFATTSLLVISSAAANAQALAPSTLHLTSPEQETKKDIVQVFTKDPAQAVTKEKSPEQKTKKEIVRATTQEPLPVITKRSAQVNAKKPAKVITKETVSVITKKPAQVIAKDSARTFAIEPVRPMNQQSASAPTRPAFHFNFKTPEGKTESAPVVTQYYPKRIVYPFAKIDRHIDRRLMQAATIAQERAHAHSRSMCWHYVKEALLASGVINSRPQSELARDAAQDLVSNYGFKRLSVTDPFSAPVGSVLVYGTSRTVGHVELRTQDGFVSDFVSKTPSRRPLLGVYAKL
jgi:hypothetical protein